MTSQTTEQNRAAWLTDKQVIPLEVKEAPMTPLPEDYVRIRVRAVAINPVDYYIQKSGIIIEEFPAIIGCDVAGTIVELGPKAQEVRAGYDDATPLAIGDRVIVCIDSMKEPGAFQLYTAACATQVAKLPDNVSFADGCVIPLGLATAASGMFDEDQMALPVPRIDAQPTGKIVLIWGAGSSVGTMAVLMAKAAGLEVAATASAANKDYLISLGVDHPFDYRDPDVVDKIAEVMKGKESLGAYNAATQDAGDLIKCGEVTQKAGGKKVVGTVLPAFLPFPEGLPQDVKYTNSFGVTKKAVPWVVNVWGKWVTPALENGTLQTKPEKLVFGKGLESIQGALDRWAKGVSAKKIVVEFD